MTGGIGGLKKISSTEIYKQSAWSYVASLPFPHSSFSAATVDNSVFVFGKKFNFPLKLNFLLFVFKEELVVVVILKGSTDMIQPVTNGQLWGE